MKKKGGLGKGLDAIFMENTTENGNDTVVLALEEITPNREQPRKEFDEEKIAELADSIRQHGVLQPLLVRPMVTGGYQIVAGERRFRAAAWRDCMKCRLSCGSWKMPRLPNWH